jgi:hypothetical protein
MQYTRVYSGHWIGHGGPRASLTTRFFFFVWRTLKDVCTRIIQQNLKVCGNVLLMSVKVKSKAILVTGHGGLCTIDKCASMNPHVN